MSSLFSNIQNQISTLSFLKNHKTWILILSTIGLLTGIQALFEGSRIFGEHTYTHYNNYLIFKQSFYHLIHNQDLYAFYPKEHFDLFKYSSTFALLFSVFALLPDYLGLPLWNIFNLVFLFAAIAFIPRFKKEHLYFILFLGLFEYITSAQNEQSNTFVAGLIILTYALLEKKKYFLATLCIVLSVYTKLYGIVGFSLFLLYPNKPKIAIYTIFWFIILFFLPLIVIDFNQLIFNYQSWFELLKREHPQIYGISVMGWLNSWFGYNGTGAYPLLVGVLLFCLPLLRHKLYTNKKFSLFLLSSVLIWVVIFNHRAESASYVIAYTGVCIWFLNSKKTKLDIGLLVLAFILTTISPTDLFPRFLRENFVQPYALKGFPIILIWLKILWDMGSLTKLLQKPNIVFKE